MLTAKLAALIPKHRINLTHYRKCLLHRNIHSVCYVLIAVIE